MILKHVAALNHKKIVLASASPRRSEILANLGLHIQVVKSDFAENLAKEGKSAAEYAVATASGKGRAVLATMTDADLIIAADTVVEKDGAVLEKAADAAHAQRMLRSLSGARHAVHTGVMLCGMHKGAPWERTFHQSTEVLFGDIDADEIDAYIATGECFGKAGAYGIQGPAGAWVVSLRGCYFNVMGFPVHAFATALQGVIAQGYLQLE